MRTDAAVGFGNFWRRGFQPASKARVAASAATTSASVRTTASLSGSNMRVECVLKKSADTTSAVSQQASMPAVQAVASLEAAGCGMRAAAAPDVCAVVLAIDECGIGHRRHECRHRRRWFSGRLVVLQRFYKLLQAGTFGVGCCLQGRLGMWQCALFFAQLKIYLRERAAQRPLLVL